LLRTHHFDVFEVLDGELRHRNVEDADVVLADEVKQEVERSLELLEKDFQRVGGDVEVVGKFEHRLPVDQGQGRRCRSAGGKRVQRRCVVT
jgi:hypothetical protein